MWERRGRRGGEVGRTHQKARLTIAELFEHGQPDHAIRCSQTDGSTACLFFRLLVSASLRLEFNRLDWLTLSVTTVTITSRCRHTSHRNHTRPPPSRRQQHDLSTRYPHHRRRSHGHVYLIDLFSFFKWGICLLIRS